MGTLQGRLALSGVMEHIYSNQEFKVISPYLANSRLTLVTGDLPQKQNKVLYPKWLAQLV